MLRIVIIFLLLFFLDPHGLFLFDLILVHFLDMRPIAFPTKRKVTVFTLSRVLVCFQSTNRSKARLQFAVLSLKHGDVLVAHGVAGFDPLGELEHFAFLGEGKLRGGLHDGVEVGC